MRLSLLLFITFVSVLCGAQTKKASPQNTAPTQELSLRQKALAENKIEGLTKTSASDAQVSGMLTLKDPRPEIITRTWKYFVGFSAQSFQAEGFATKEGAGTFDLGKNGQTVMPGVELGVLTPSWAAGTVLWKFGLRAKGGFSSQSTDVKLNSGYTIDDARLNTTLFSGGLLMSMQWDRLPWLSLTLSPQYGSVNYTQTSANEFASFSKQAGFNSMSYGLDFAFSKTWSLFTEWTQRDLKDRSEIALQKDNFELGTKVTW